MRIRVPYTSSDDENVIPTNGRSGSSSQNSRNRAPPVKSRNRSGSSSQNSRNRELTGMLTSCSVPQDYGIRQVAGDGRCLFRSLVQAENNAAGLEVLSRDDEKRLADGLRRSVVGIIRNNAAAYGDSWYIYGSFEDEEIRRPNGTTNMITYSHDQYVDRMSKPSTYGTQLELSIVAMLYDRNICVKNVTPGGEFTTVIQPIDGRRVNSRKRPLFLRLENIHYEPFLGPLIPRRNNNLLQYLVRERPDRPRTAARRRIFRASLGNK